MTNGLALPPASDQGPGAPADGGPGERARLLALLERHGWNATSFQTLERGLHYWFDGDDACVAYADTGGAWVVAGAPVAARRSARRGRRSLHRRRPPPAQARVLLRRRAALRRGLRPRPRARRRTARLGLRALGRRARRLARSARAVAPRARQGRAGAGGRRGRGVRPRVALARLARGALGARARLARPGPDGLLGRPRPLLLRRRAALLRGRARGAPRRPARRRARLRAPGLALRKPRPRPRGPQRQRRAPRRRRHARRRGRGQRYVTLGLAPLAGPLPPGLLLARAWGTALYDFEGVRAFKADATAPRPPRRGRPGRRGVPKFEAPWARSAAPEAGDGRRLRLALDEARRAFAWPGVPRQRGGASWPRRNA